MDPIIVSSIAFLICLCLYFSMLNSLVQHSAQVNQAIGTLSAQYKQRFDLIPDVNKAAKTAVRVQREYFDKLLAFRKGLHPTIELGDLGTMPPDLIPMAVGAMAASAGKAVIENNPAMNVDGYTELQRILLSTEKDVTAARRFYWAAVAEYNAAIRSFPAAIIASLHGYKMIPQEVITPQLETKPDYGIDA